jgi:predicted dithiol-disulfide oxidoreductase (DUF899 family)
MWRHDLDQGCVGCSLHTDHAQGAYPHLVHHDVSFVVVSRAPYAEIAPFKERMGWRFTWVSSHGSEFNRDHQVSFTADEIRSGRAQYNYAETEFPDEEAPGMSVFLRNDAGEIFHTYSCYARGLDGLVGTYNLLDLVPKGRDEDGYAFTMQWVRHRDRYEDEKPAATPACCGKAAAA